LFIVKPLTSSVNLELQYNNAYLDLCNDFYYLYETSQNLFQLKSYLGGYIFKTLSFAFEFLKP